jgi:hypothetical protein
MPLTYLSKALLDVRLQTEGSCGLIPIYFLCYVKIGTKGFRNRGLKDGKTGASRREAPHESAVSRVMFDRRDLVVQISKATKMLIVRWSANKFLR